MLVSPRSSLMAPCARYIMTFFDWMKAVLLASVGSFASAVSFGIAHSIGQVDTSRLITDAVTYLVAVIIVASYIIINKINSLKKTP